MQDELRAAIERALAATELPRDIREWIFSVVSALPLGVEETYDVAMELIAHFEDGMTAGRPPAELLAAFGNEQTIAGLIRKTTRRRWPIRQDTKHIMGGHSFGGTLWQNFRYAGRRLAQSPGFTATAILSLALGIGANTAIFSLVNAVILREPPFDAPDRLVDLYISTPDFQYDPFSYPNFKDLREGTRDVFEDVAVSRLVIVQVDHEGGVEILSGEAVSGNYFPMLGLEAKVGRTLLPEDDLTPGAHPVVMLEHGYWQRSFGGRPEVVGQDIRLGGRAYTIVGVAPEEYSGMLRGVTPTVIAPIMMMDELQPTSGNELERRGAHYYFVKARLAPGVTTTDARTSLDRLANHMRELHLENFDPDTGFALVPTQDVIIYPAFDDYVRAAAWLLMAMVGLVLLMACTNLAGFLLARGVDRRKEIALRRALGASRRILIGQLLSETVLLGLAGGVAGVAVAAGLLHLLVSADLPTPIPITLDLSLDATVLGFCLAVSLLAGLVLGLAPALHSTNPDVASIIRDESTGGEGRGRSRLSNMLVVAQVAGSLVLLVGAGLFLRSARQLQSVDPGFGREPTGILSLLVPSNRYSEEEGRVFARALMDRIRQLPGVQSVGLIGNMHLDVSNVAMMSINVDGVDPPQGREFHRVDQTAVDPGFFDAAGIRILRGRNFNEHDLSGAPPVAVINQAMADRFWPDQDPVGRMIRRIDADDLMVVGVSTNAKIRSMGKPPRPFIYRPYGQSYRTFFHVLARTSLDPSRTAHEMMAAGRELDPDLWVWETKTMERYLSVHLMPARLSALIITAFAVVALALATIGLYGIVSYAVSRRTREVGIRMSLGADRIRVIRTLMGNAIQLVVIGGVMGIGLAWAAAALLSGFLFDVSSRDPMTFLLAIAVLGAAAIIAAYIPARRAGRMDPATALRTE
jgi:predicted permease